MANKEKSTVNHRKSRIRVVQQEKEVPKTRGPGGGARASGASEGQPEPASETSEPGEGQSQAKQHKKGEALTGRAMMRKAFKNLSEKLDTKKDSSNAIDDLVKLAKLEKDWSGEAKGVKEIKVRWEQEKDKSSNEK